jgi:hypothetical protein
VSPAKHAICTFCKKQGHFERAYLKKNAHGKEKEIKSQHPVEVPADQDSSGYEDEYDLNAVSIHAIANRKSCEVFAPVVFNPNNGLKSVTNTMGKVDTGAMVSCMPISMIGQIGLSEKYLTPSSAVIRGMSGADLHNCGTIDANVTCNGIIACSNCTGVHTTKHIS